MKKHHWGLLSLLTLVVFLAVLFNAVISAVAIFTLINNGVLILTDVTAADAGRVLGFCTIFSIPVGIIVALLASKVPLKPIRVLIDSMDRLASGDFSTRAKVGFVMQMYPPYVNVANSFNKMAQQLENTEMLRTDFINNLSHEFKTPLVSIAGFAGLLRKGDLTQEQQHEYIAIIEEESRRLSRMATNVLNLTKVENQTILSDVTWYNLSEQIRDCVLLLESKWSRRDLELDLEFGEYMISANEELMKQVWINLLENAIKFTPDGERITIRIRETDAKQLVTITNTGVEIPEESRNRIFQKFYQADESHATEGNGIGLAIVTKITELHGGTVKLRSGYNQTSFTVTLPTLTENPLQSRKSSL